MMKTLLLNRDFEAPKDGYYQIIPLGNFPITLPPAADGERPLKLVQVLDAPAAQSICNRFAEAAKLAGFGGLLVDYDHFSLDADKSSAAAGWITELQNRADGVYARIRWSDEGEKAVNGGRFRFCSPVFDLENCEDLGGGQVRPLSLTNLALTNDPRLKTLRPLTNRSSADTAGNKKGNEGMDKIAKALGLAETATPEEIQSALDAKLARLAELEQKATEAQAEADMAPYADQIENAGEVKKVLCANRAAGLSLLAALKKPVAPARELPNRKTAADPAKFLKLKNRADEQMALVNSIRKSEGCTFEKAWDKARVENPELFADEQ